MTDLNLPNKNSISNIRKSIMKEYKHKVALLKNKWSTMDRSQL